MMLETMSLGRVRVLSALSLAVLLLLAAWGGEAVAATASGARLGLHGEGVTRFVVDLSDSVGFKVSSRADPYRVVIEAPAIQWVPPAGVKPWGAVNGIRGEEGRIVLDLRKPALVKNAFLIAPRDNMGWRLVVDLGETTRDAFMASVEGAAPAAKPVAAAKAAPPKPQSPPAIKLIPPPAMAEPEPVAVEAAPNPPAIVADRPSSKIVLTSPNAPAPVVSPLASPPLPEPVTAAPVVLTPPPASPAPPPAMAGAPLPSPRPGTGEKPARGAPMISAPMPPPPERPVVGAPAPVLAPPVVPAPPVVQAVAPAPNPPPQAPAKGESLTKARDGVPVIVIDPGHGGVDPGAIGVSGIYEKHITLAMARELKTALEKNGRYRVQLTRDRDVFIRLRERVAIARQQGADLFISLHADAVQNPQIRGLSVYTLSQNASDSEAQTLAEKENKADLIAGVDLTHESPDVAGILIDLAQRETMNRSAGFATELVDEVGQEMDLLGNTHRFAGFAVLKAPDVPAVLVEMGYLSNEYEEKQLRQPQYRARLAKALAKAVERYFPPSLKAKRP